MHVVVQMKSCTSPKNRDEIRKEWFRIMKQSGLIAKRLYTKIFPTLAEFVIVQNVPGLYGYIEEMERISSAEEVLNGELPDVPALSDILVERTASNFTNWMS